MTSLERPIRRVRRENLDRLATEVGGALPLAIKTGTAYTHLIAIMKQRRDLGDALAAKLEEGCGKPFGWMDLPHQPRKAA